MSNARLFYVEERKKTEKGESIDLEVFPETHHFILFLSRINEITYSL